VGKGKYQAWKDGKFTFSALTTTYEDSVYGTMWREASLKELVPNG